MVSNILEEDLRYISNFDLPFEKMKGKRVLVTGATGLIGVSIVRSLLAIGDIEVIAFVRNQEKAKNIYGDLIGDSLKLYISNIVDEIKMADTIDYIFHCASITTSKLMIEKPVETIMTSLEGTKNVLNFAREKECESIVYISSMEVYGAFNESKVIKEEDMGFINPLKVRSNYPECKRMCENMCISYFYEYGVPVKIARLAQTFGAGILPGENRIFAQFAKSVIEGKDIILHTEGKSEGNYCYTRDCMTGLLTILLKGKNGEAYNVSNPETHTNIAGMAELVAKKISKNKIKVIYEIPEANIFGYANDTKMKLNSDKLQNLGWYPSVGLEESYIRMIDDMIKNDD